VNQPYLLLLTYRLRLDWPGKAVVEARSMPWPTLAAKRLSGKDG
jgi:hypothetical protein